MKIFLFLIKFNNLAVIQLSKNCEINQLMVSTAWELYGCFYWNIELMATSKNPQFIINQILRLRFLNSFKNRSSSSMDKILILVFGATRTFTPYSLSSYDKILLFLRKDESC